MVIVLCAFIADFDIIFTTFTQQENHRIFFSHSIFPSLFFLILGIIFNSYFIIACGIAYLSHIILDTIDWGTNILYFQKKQIGFKFLISKKEIENLNTFLCNYRVARSFFDFRYYNSKLMQLIEIFTFIIMIFLMIFFAFEYILMIIFYFMSVSIHLYTHYHLKKIEQV